MQIVIDIPDFIYNGIRNVTEGKGIIEYNAKALYNAIYYGIPLPKGHGDLIDADAVMREMSVVSSRSVKSQMYIIKLAPIIIEKDGD